VSEEDRLAWDERFRAGDIHADTSPDPFLTQLQEYSGLFAATRQALDVACGGGRNAVWLAQQGWDVLACDISLWGLRRAKALAEERGVPFGSACGSTSSTSVPSTLLRDDEHGRTVSVSKGSPAPVAGRLNLFCQDLETVSLPPARFDLIVCFFYLEQELFPQLKTALRPEGLLVYKTYTRDQQRFRGPRHPMHLLRTQELLEQFRGFRILFYQELVQGRGVAQLIAQKREGATGPVPSTNC